ncbi:MFS transporter [Streptantibioticus rubrisoli]|uniref:MFS transporter n=1 Tax=Streptantibioticus rubrisoli TaxID=1387313 RepID=A0ABT1PCK9_9ACTN|nr:MFS transporter [Streptantibioticus rubrisoli]MCQ4043097.1 MFS transporter [Streptantibioticus rubrisoli]
MTRTGTRTAAARSGTGEQAGFGPRFITPLLLGAVLNPVNSTMIATALAAIGTDLHVGAAQTAWLMASLYLASAIGQPAMGRLADLLGARRVFLASLVLVCAAGAVGALAPSLGWLVVSRMLLGLGTSGAYPAAMALLRAESERLDRQTPRTVLGLLSLAGLSSAAVGPVLGGVLTATLGWRAIFAVNMPLAVVALALAALWLPGGRPAGSPRATAALDPVGIALFAAALTVTTVFLMRLDHPRWPLLPVLVVLGAVLTWWELRRAVPFIDPRMLTRNRALAATYLRHGIAYLVIYCVMYGYSQWLEEAHGISVFDTGLVMLPMSVAAAVCSLLGARTKGIRAQLTLAAALLAVGSAGLLLAGAHTPLAVVLLIGTVFGLPQGLTSTGNQAAVYVQAPPGGTGAAAGLQRTAQYLGAIVASSLIGLFYGSRATDAALHGMAATAGALSVLLLALTIADRALRARRH